MGPIAEELGQLENPEEIVFPEFREPDRPKEEMTLDDGLIALGNLSLAMAEYLTEKQKVSTMSISSNAGTIRIEDAMVSVRSFLEERK